MIEVEIEKFSIKTLKLIFFFPTFSAYFQAPSATLTRRATSAVAARRMCGK
jgi:hypothetical protein